MLYNTLLSPNEHKSLLAIGFVLCSFYFVNISDKIIVGYNETVKSGQTEKQRIANNERGFSFEVCVFRSTPVYEIILSLQFLLIPLLLLSLKKQNLVRFIISHLLTLFVLYGYIGWMFETYDLMTSDIAFNKESIFFNNYILYQSSILEFVLFLIFAVLFIIQSAILLRFGIEKFQAKIS